MEGLQQLIILAILVEAAWENGKMVWQEGKFSIDRAGALAVGLAFAFTISVDILALAGFTPSSSVPGTIATGLIISRGGNTVHEVIQRLGGKNNG